MSWKKKLKNMIHKKDNMNIDEQYLTIAKSILERGTEKNDRTGTGTKSIFSAQVVHDMKEGFPLLTTKKVFFKGIVSELLWFLRGETNIKWLVENNNNIWVGDAYKFYLEHYVDEYNEELEKKNEGLGWMAQELVNIRPLSKEQFIEKIKTDDEFANKWGELGPIYGAQWRDWGGEFSEYHSDRKGGKGKHFKGIDQISQAIHTLKTNPDSRRIIIGHLSYIQKKLI
jgi:thymidylate synthase